MKVNLILFGSPEIKSGEKYLLIILDNSAKDYLERVREGFYFQIQFFLTVCGKVVFPGWSKMPRCKAPPSTGSG